MNTFSTAARVVDSTNQNFVQHTFVGGEQVRNEFSKTILWLQETETQVMFVHGGNVLREGSTYNDFYGYMTSIEAANDEIVRLQKHFGITDESTITLLLTTKVFRLPALETDETRAENSRRPENYKKAYASVPREWLVETVCDGETQLQRLTQQVIATEVIWSSKMTAAQIEQTRSLFRKQHEVDLNVLHAAIAR
jgi:hypothetical protein